MAIALTQKLKVPPPLFFRKVLIAANGILTTVSSQHLTTSVRTLTQSARELVAGLTIRRTSRSDYLWDRLPVGQATCGTGYQWDRIPVGQTICETGYLWDTLSVRQATCGTGYLWDRIPVGQTICETGYQWTGYLWTGYLCTGYLCYRLPVGEVICGLWDRLPVGQVIRWTGYLWSRLPVGKAGVRQANLLGQASRRTNKLLCKK